MNNIGALRRRVYGKNEGGSLLYPDAYMAVFSCDAMTTYNLMYANSINKYILDGTEVTPNSMVNSVTPTTDGKHILYFWLGRDDRMADKNWSGAPEYLRIPANPYGWHKAFIHNAGGLVRVDFLGDVPPEFDSAFGNHIPNLTEIRVPVGAGSAYATAFSNAAWAIRQLVGSIVETSDFSYTI